MALFREGLKEAKADLAKQRERWRALGLSPQLRREAKAVAVEHNGHFERTKKELKLIRPHYERAEAQIEQHIEKRAKEIEHDKGRGGGFER